MRKYKKALLIGRFQPFHLGHLYLIKKALEVADEIVVGIGSANIYDGNNPLDWRAREKILKSVFYKENMEIRVERIVALDDFFNDEKWLANVKDRAGDFDIVVGNNEWVNRIMEKGGYKVLRVPYYKRYLYEGEKIRKLLLENGNWQKRVPQYLIKFISENLTENLDHVVLGGTFDRFHKGHKALIDKAFTVGKKVTVGIATQELYKGKKLSNVIEPFFKRKKSVREYLASKNWTSKAKLISFSVFSGPLDTKKNVSAIVVSGQTLPNALKINRMRIENNVPPLKTVLVGDVLAQDGKMISSERIREGTIDRGGKVYLKVFEKKLSLPEALKEELRRPLGRVIRGNLKNENQTAKKSIALIKRDKPAMTIAVGDIIAGSLAKNGFIPDVKIIDFRSRRALLDNKSSLEGEALLSNPPGTITPDAARAIKKSINAGLTTSESQTVTIEGEEDLLTLPAILLAPLGSLVLYGHWRLGVVAVTVDEEKKSDVLKILEKFE